MVAICERLGRNENAKKVLQSGQHLLGVAPQVIPANIYIYVTCQLCSLSAPKARKTW